MMRKSAVLLLVLVLVVAVPSDGVENVENSGSEVTTEAVEVTTKQHDVREVFQMIVDRIVNDQFSTMTRVALESGISQTCSFGLLKFSLAIRKLEPWAVRLLDASAKIPTGVFQGTLSDLGAFDECIETVIKNDYDVVTVRGQYCNLYVKTINTTFFDHLEPALKLSHRRTPIFVRYQEDDHISGVRLGVCLMDDCTGEDLQKLAQAFLGKYGIEIRVRGCVTQQPVKISQMQVIVMSIMGTLLILVILGTSVDVYKRRCSGKDQNTGIVVRCITAFSCHSNHKLLFRVVHDKSEDAYKYRFIHGMKFFSMFWIVLGHSYTTFDFINVSRLVNALHYGDNILFCFVMAGMMSVDTFLFVTGFLLTYNVMKRTGKANSAQVITVGLIRRWIRGTVPAFFLIAIIYLFPLFVNGPDFAVGYSNFEKTISKQWINLILQIRNFTKELHQSIGHLWYLSTDFQLFIVGLLVIQLFKKKIVAMICILVFLSLVGCSVTGVLVYDSEYTPFVLPMAEKFSIMKDTLNDVYALPSTHAVSFFGGIISSVLALKHQEAKISWVKQLALWLMGTTCVLTAILGMYEWNRGSNPGDLAEVTFAFSQRLLWAIGLGWVCYACATGKGGFVNTFLSWPAFVPLSRLSFGVYLFHLPYYFVQLNTTRERIYFSNYNMITRAFGAFVWSYFAAYFMFMFCEAPIGKLEKMIFQRRDKKPERKNPEISISPATIAENGWASSAKTVNTEPNYSVNGDTSRL